ncbi:MAG: UDP-glucose 4-epimerase GalE [Saprospiraceae bacterium]|nr:UDP-glucose 4-epimerase GalE [Saprospiraceae bacterium]
MNKILVTGGCGYIGSHTLVDLIENGFDVDCVDSLINSEDKVLKNIEKITGKKIINTRLDLSKEDSLSILNKSYNNIDGVIHFAALKSVSESVKNPLLYYENNVKSFINILKFINDNKIKAFIFSSSCTVYGNTRELPVHEELPFQETGSTYGRTKQICEQILSDYYSDSNFPLKSISLRYFNPAGAHPTYLLGESPINPPLNLIPAITETAIGIRNKLLIHGDNYPTKDGTCVRDYIHVMDLAHAHCLALKHMLNDRQSNPLEVFNLGIGNGVSVKEAIYTFESVNNIKLNYEIGPRREGDLPAMYADNTKITKHLNWAPKYTIKEIMRDAWEWEKLRRPLSK